MFLSSVHHSSLITHRSPFPACVSIIRHAWAEEPDASRFAHDSERPLTSEGRRRFRDVVAALVERGFAPQVLATSPYVRTRQTADIIAKHVAGKPSIVELPSLACGARLHELLDWTATRDETEIVWVGHMPDVSMLAGALVGATGEPFDFAKGAAAAIDFDDRPAIGQGSLRWFVNAKMLGC